MMDFHTAYLYAINNLDEETLQRIFEKLREEVRNFPIVFDDDMLDPDVAVILQENGCTIEDHLEFQRVIFPAGTQLDQYLVTSVTRSLLILPSGLRVRQIGKPNRIYSCLFVEGQNDPPTLT